MPDLDCRPNYYVEIVSHSITIMATEDSSAQNGSHAGSNGKPVNAFASLSNRDTELVVLALQCTRGELKVSSSSLWRAPKHPVRAAV